jgi:hypothetical protein
MNRQRIAGISRSRWSICLLAALLVYSIGTPTLTYAFVSPTTATTKAVPLSRILTCIKKDCHHHRYRRCCNHDCRSSSQLHAVEVEVAAAVGLGLQNYAPAAATLFNNMKLPAAVVTAGMISLGFATRYPELPRDSLEKVYSQELRQQCAKLERMHIVLGLVSVTSELIVVLWAAVEVNQLTERAYEPAYSVWDLIHRDCDLAWSAVNSHFIIGIIGFTAMLWLRAYVMLLSAKASNRLMVSASTGTAAALCLMVSIVNRGVESGGGNRYDSYGSTILDLFTHYASLLLQFATDADSPGPLQLLAMVLETTSLCFMFMVLVTESDASFEEEVNEDSCPLDLYEILNDDKEVAKLSATELEKLKTCIILEEDEQRRQEASLPSIEEEEEEKRRELEDSQDSSVNVV